MNIRISAQLSIPDNEVVISAVRSQGAGGQNVNKVSSAIHLRFDVRASSLPESCKQRLLSLRDQRLSKDGVIVIKAQQYRTREKNLEAAISRLREIIRQATTRVKKRRATKPTRSSQQKRLDRKNRHGRTKVLRGKVYD
ncbi:MAG: alternative ribosome rescue aminoacyl-tRNA hydrolase ArfB [Gammaproteobacteria bacterium]|nr:MAG: alternative ribosome rescue aminoacyl-tRNA hydrolase ArfB [Gammaproteobacteria bacterium]